MLVVGALAAIFAAATILSSSLLRFGAFWRGCFYADHCKNSAFIGASFIKLWVAPWKLQVLYRRRHLCRRQELAIAVVGGKII
jgi:hypothetical protein